MSVPDVSVSDDHKRCPDCAELVRAQARKCRFCGYRFDGDTAQGGGTTKAGTAQGRGTTKDPRSPNEAPSSVAELVSDWGTELDSDEEIAFFLPARVLEIDAKPANRDTESFLLITNRRLFLYRPLRRNVLDLLRHGRGSVEVAFSVSLADAIPVSVERRWRRAELRLGDQLLLGGVPPKKLEEIRRYLTARAETQTD